MMDRYGHSKKEIVRSRSLGRKGRAPGSQAKFTRTILWLQRHDGRYCKLGRGLIYIHSTISIQ